MPTSSRGYVSEDPNVPNVDGAHMMTVRMRKWNCMSKICAEHAMYGGGGGGGEGRVKEKRERGGGKK